MAEVRDETRVDEAEREVPAVEFVGVSRRPSARCAPSTRSTWPVRDGEFFSMLGPSGSGKTTRLRLIAGLRDPTAGEVRLHGEVVNRRAPYERDVQHRLPGLRAVPAHDRGRQRRVRLLVRKVAKAERRRRVGEPSSSCTWRGWPIAAPPSLRWPASAGGARPGTGEPAAVLLLDEPLGALDLKLRQAMQVELKAIQQEVGISFVFVTHDQEEALTMSDRVAVFQNGQGGPGRDTRAGLRAPGDHLRRGFVGTSNVVSGPLAEHHRLDRRLHRAAREDPPAPQRRRRQGRRGAWWTPPCATSCTPAHTRYPLELDGGGDLTVVEQNLTTTSDDVLAEGPLAQRRLGAGRQPPRRPRRHPDLQRPTDTWGEHPHEEARLPVVLLAALMLVAAACGSDSDSDGGDSGSSDTTLPAEVGEGEGAPNIVAWPGYIEDGSNDEAYDWVSDFGDETGCQVEVKTASTSDEMVQLMSNSDEYDLVTASGDASLRPIAGERPAGEHRPGAQLRQRRPAAAGRAWYTVDGANYGVPLPVGCRRADVQHRHLPEAPTSWDVVFEEQDLPDGESNSGRVQAYDGPIYIASAALYLQAHEPDLGIGTLRPEPGAVRRRHRAAPAAPARAALLARRDGPGGGLHQRGASSPRARGPYQVNLLKSDGQPIDSTIPEEAPPAGRTPPCWRSQPPPELRLPLDGPLPRRQGQGDVASWFGSVPVVPDACEGNDSWADGCATNGIDNRRHRVLEDAEADCFGDGGRCVPYSGGRRVPP